MVDMPLPITTEIQIGGEWTDISEDVRASQSVRITRGRSDEAGTADPSKMQLKLNNRHGRYSPRNPHSPYYGQLGRNTPIRLRVGTLPADPDPILADTFDRTIADGWGVADTGHSWDIASGSAGDFSVDGAGEIVVSDAETLRLVAAILHEPITGVDCTATVAVSDYIQGHLPGALWVSLRFWNRSLDANSATILGYRVDTGAATGLGWLSAETSTHTGVDTAPEPVPGVTYAPDRWLRVRAQTAGGAIRMRVWPEGEQEPDVWHTQAHYPADVTLGHGVGIGAQASPSADVSDPVTVRVRDVHVRPYVEPAAVVRYVGEVSAWPPRWDTSGNDAWVPVTASGITRRISQRDSPERSLARAVHIQHRPAEYWPLEDGPDTTQAASAVGGQPLRVRRLDFGEGEELTTSGPLPATVGSPLVQSGALRVRATGAWSISMIAYLPSGSVPDTDGQSELLVRVHTTGGTAATWEWRVEYSDTDGLLRRCRAYDDDGVELDQHYLIEDEDLLLDRWIYVWLQASQDGSEVSWQSGYTGLSEVYSETFNTSYAGEVGRPDRLAMRIGSGLAGITIGHIAVWGGVDSTAGAEIRSRTIGGETAGQRLSRLAAAADVPMVVRGRDETTMGAQPTAALSALLEECEAADLGMLAEQRDRLGLAYRTRASMYSQTPALVLDYASGEISPPLEPTDDDQQVRNDVTVKRARGSEARVLDEDGPMGVETIGRYDESVTINVANDGQLPAQAAWRLHLGTVNEVRVPTLTLNLANPRMRQHHEAIMALDTGDRIQVTNPPVWVGGDTLDLIVQGYEENLGLYQWDSALTCTPASPWDVWTLRDRNEILEDFEDDDYALTITDGGDTGWVRTDAHAYGGSWSLRSGAVTHDQTSEAVVEVPADAEEMRLWYRVSSEDGYDHFRVLLDGVVELEESGEVGWTYHTVDVSTVSQVTVRYAKDGSVSEGDDAAYIDELTFVLSAAASDVTQTSRLDTAGSQLAVAAGDADTELVVATDSPHRVWITTDSHPDDLPMWLQLGGEVVRVDTVEGGQSPQTMTVERAVNGITKSHPAGTRVRLARTEDA